MTRKTLMKWEDNVLKEAVTKGHPKETIEERLCITGYQLGDLMKCLSYARIYDNDNYILEAMVTMTDLLANLRVICLKYGWDYDNLMQSGIERLVERIERRLGKGE